MTRVLVGVDIGTTRVKAVATDLDLRVLGEHTVATPWRHHGANAEVDPAALADATAVAAAGAAREAGAQALAVGMTGMAETGVLLDGHGAPLGPALAWHDPRGDSDEVRARLGEQAYRRTAGRPIDAVSSLPKLLWLRRHVPETRRAVRFLSVPEWAVHALGGDQVSELSLVSRTGLFDVPGRAPWLEALALLDAGPSFLGEVVAAGQPVGRAGSSAPAELRGAVLTVAGHDHQTAAFALGAAVDGALFDSLGTAEALVRTVRAPLDEGAIDRMAQLNISTGLGGCPGPPVPARRPADRHLVGARRRDGRGADAGGPDRAGPARTGRRPVADGDAGLGELPRADRARRRRRGGPRARLAGGGRGPQREVAGASWRRCRPRWASTGRSSWPGAGCTTRSSGWSRSSSTATSSTLGLPEPGATGAAQMAGIAAGALSPPWRDDGS